MSLNSYAHILNFLIVKYISSSVLGCCCCCSCCCYSLLLFSCRFLLLCCFLHFPALCHRRRHRYSAPSSYSVFGLFFLFNFFFLCFSVFLFRSRIVYTVLLLLYKSLLFSFSFSFLRFEPYVLCSLFRTILLFFVDTL